MAAVRQPESLAAALTGLMIAELATKHPGGNRQDCAPDECHLCWGDVCGDVWEKTKLRVKVAMASPGEKQTYFGALD